MDKKSKTIFICDFNGCEKVFTTKYSMIRHAAVHKKKKSFKWKDCDKQFSFQQNLVEHQFIHSGELPYLWGVNGCTMRFRQRGKLSLHRQSHTNYVKKSYTSHSVLNESENNSNMIASSEIPSSECQTYRFTNQTPLINQLSQKANEICNPASRYFIMGQSYTNGVYKLAKLPIRQINIFDNPNNYQFNQYGKQLPKLSIVLMSNNQLSCQLQ